MLTNFFMYTFFFCDFIYFIYDRIYKYKQQKKHMKYLNLNEFHHQPRVGNGHDMEPVECISQ